MADSDYTDSDIEGSRKRVRTRRSKEERTDSGVSVSGSRWIVKDIEKADEEMPMDPADAFPVELFLHLLSFLSTPAALAPCFTVSKAWNLAANDRRLWDVMTWDLWRDKFYVAQKYKDLLEQGEPKQAYRGSLEDSKRDWLTTEELCEFTWQWRFKEVAGEHFTADDPYFSGLPPRERKYTPSGRVTGPYTFPETKWRFVKSAEGKLGPWGKFLRVWNTPAAVVGRHPGHWGFYMQSCWHLSTSFPLPRPGVDPLMDDDNLTVTTSTQRYEVICYNGGLEYGDDEVLDRKGFEKVCKRAGWDLRRMRGWDSDDEGELDLEELFGSEDEGSEEEDGSDDDEEDGEGAMDMQAALQLLFGDQSGDEEEDESFVGSGEDGEVEEGEEDEEGDGADAAIAGSRPTMQPTTELRNTESG